MGYKSFNRSVHDMYRALFMPRCVLCFKVGLSTLKLLKSSIDMDHSWCPSENLLRIMSSGVADSARRSTCTSVLATNPLSTRIGEPRGLIH